MQTAFSLARPVCCGLFQIAVCARSCRQAVERTGSSIQRRRVCMPYRTPPSYSVFTMTRPPSRSLVKIHRAMEEPQQSDVLYYSAQSVFRFLDDESNLRSHQSRGAAVDASTVIRVPPRRPTCLRFTKPRNKSNHCHHMRRACAVAVSSCSTRSEASSRDRASLAAGQAPCPSQTSDRPPICCIVASV